MGIIDVIYLDEGEGSPSEELNSISASEALGRASHGLEASSMGGSAPTTANNSHGNTSSNYVSLNNHENTTNDNRGDQSPFTDRSYAIERAEKELRTYIMMGEQQAKCLA
jgi:hypothetical protein